jgi:putative DNA primase/helicase
MTKRKTPPKPPPAQQPQLVVLPVLSDGARNDSENADVFVQLHGHRFAWDEKRKDWLVFHTGDWMPCSSPLHRRIGADRRRIERRYKQEVARAHTWKRDAELTVMTAAEDVCGELLVRAEELPPDKQAKAIKQAVDVGNSYRMLALMNLAKSQLARSGWDEKRYLLGCANGVLDLQTGKLRDGAPEDLITRTTGIVYDTHAECPMWDNFLDEIFQQDHELIAYLWRVLGYSLTGDTSERAFFIFHGDGRNGKSTFIETFKAALGERGTGYAQKARFSTFLQKRNVGSGANDDIAHLEGARVVIATEADDRTPLDVAAIKELTGGDTVRARHLYKGEKEFKPEAKIFMITNKIPPINEDTSAIWDRLHYVPFAYRVPDNKVDKKLGQKLLAELPGILAHAVCACLEWQQYGLCPPEKVQRAKAGLREDMDRYLPFLKERCEFKEDGCGEYEPREYLEFEATQSQLYGEFKSWAQDNGYKHNYASSKRLFNYLKQKANSGELTIWMDGELHHSTVWRGIRVRLLKK